ncbi:regulatory protein GemA [Ochrobactrum sp. MR28]|nr:regulatory protein GemA [Ochrobactrum sp. MR28]MBX8818139.1 regulatory protein GemA [Ochrobactrum sp. MR31]
MSTFSSIYVAKKQLGLDDDDFRSLCERVTGKRSTRDMSEPQRAKLVEHFRKQGFKPVSKDTRKQLEGRYAAKLQALWIAGYNLGVVTNGSDEALIAFVKRQTKLDHVRFLHDAGDAYKAIEALKRWLNRAAGVSWAQDRFLPDWANKPHGQIALTQWSILNKNNHTQGAEFGTTVWKLCGYEGKPQLNDLNDKEWQLVMNKLGEKVRTLVDKNAFNS